MDRPLRIGVIGFGVAGAAFHAPIIASTPGLELTAVVTRDADRAAAAIERYPGLHVVPDVSQLWTLDLDAVTIASPNATHVVLAHEALSQGVNVVVDKPLATTSAEAARLIASAQEAGLLLTVYFNRRWDGDFVTVSSLVADGSLGQVDRFESRFERWRPEVERRWKETAGPREGGGILYDLGPHLIDQALTLFGPAATVYAEVDTRRDGGINPDDVFLALTHTNGVRSHLWASAVAADLGPRFRVLGTAGAYRVWGLDGQEAALRAGLSPGSGGRPWGESSEAEWGLLSGSAEPTVVPTVNGDYPQFYRLWEAALRGRGALPADPADAVEGLTVIEAAMSSSAQRRVVDLRAAG